MKKIFLISCTTRPFWKKVYIKKKGFAALGVNPFSEGICYSGKHTDHKSSLSYKTLRTVYKVYPIPLRNEKSITQPKIRDILRWHSEHIYYSIHKVSELGHNWSAQEDISHWHRTRSVETDAVVRLIISLLLVSLVKQWECLTLTFPFSVCLLYECTHFIALSVCIISPAVQYSHVLVALGVLGNFFSRLYFKMFFLFFLRKKRLWHCMQIVLCMNCHSLYHGEK